MTEKRVKSAERNRISKTKINTDAKIKEEKKDPPGTLYRCSDCGEQYSSQQYFYKSASPLFTGNNGYYPVCKKCIRNYYDFLVDFFSGNEEKALERICSIVDLYYCDELAAASKKTSTTTPRVASYFSKTQMKQYAEKGTTFLDTIRDRSSGAIETYDDLDEAKESGEKGVTAAAVNRWGLGFSGEEYIFLDNHYKMLKTQISDDDPMQEIYIRDMCVTKVMQSRAQKDNDADKYDKFQKSYQATAKAANLKPIDRTSDIENPEESFGNYIAMIEKCTPADLYLRPKLFKDMDSAGEYYKRFVTRPFKNFFTGSRDQDPEFSVSIGDEDG